MPKLWSATVEGHRQEVREAILDAVGELVMSQGVLALSMSAVAEAAGIGRATLYKYFPDTEELLAAWHERHVQVHLAALGALAEGEDDQAERLRKVLLAYAHICQQRRRHGAGDVTAALHRGERVAALRAQLLGLVARVIAEAAAVGVVRGDVPANELATFSVNALEAAAETTSDAALARLVDLVWSGLRRG